MTKNVLNYIMLLGFFAFLLSACSTTRRGPSKSTTIPKNFPSEDKPSSSEDESTSSKENQLRQELTTYAKQFEGAGYKYGGNGPGSFDCSGLTCSVYKKFDIAIPRTSSTQSSLGKKIPVRQARPGDLAFFSKGTNGGKINHVAIVLSYDEKGLTVIHSTSSRGVIIENVFLSNYWKSRLLYIKDVIGD